MVKIVFHGNKPMWVGLIVAIVGALMVAVHLLAFGDSEWLFNTGFAVAITGMLIYLMGRAMQLFKKRF